MTEGNLPPYIQVSTNYDKMVETDLQRRKGHFIDAFLEHKKGELGREKFEKEQAKFKEHAAKCWELAQQGKEQFRKLQERSEREIMNWEELEKPLRQWLENEAEGNDWGQDAVERTIPSYKRAFERNQRHIRAVKNRITDTRSDFRKRVLNPATREAAITKYVRNHVNWRIFMADALDILFEELEQR